MNSSRKYLLILLCVIGACASSISAQEESCYEKYFREHNKEMLPTINENDNSYDELKKEVIARQVLRGETPYAQYIADRYEQPATGQPNEQSQTIHQPVILAIDTVTGVCHLLAADGTILADAHIAMVDSTWYMWLSVDPLADKNPSSTPYMYCNGNPIMLIDPDGRDWTDIDGNKISDHSNIKAYIFYNPNEFNDQTKAMAHGLEMKYGKGAVALSNVTTMAEFAQDWELMSGNDIREVNINHHGSNQAIHLDSRRSQYITSTGTGYTQNGNPAKDISQLPNSIGDISNAVLHLNTCHSNSSGSWLGDIKRGNGDRVIPGSSSTLVGTKQTLMQACFQQLDFKVVRGTSAGVSYNRTTKQPEPQFFFQSWNYLKR